MGYFNNQNIVVRIKTAIRRRYGDRQAKNFGADDGRRGRQMARPSADVGKENR